MPDRMATGSRKKKAERADLAPREVGFFFGALAAARDRIGDVTKAIAREHSLRPRGPWMVGLIGRQSLSPIDIAKIYRIGRSTVTIELTLLQEAGLINYEKSADDGRRVELSLTPLGHDVRQRLSAGLAALLDERLPEYGREEILAAAQLLSDFAQGHHY